MKFIILSLLLLSGAHIILAQVGIGTTNPAGALDISSSNMGVVVPRVTSIESSVDATGNKPVNGTILFDQSRNKICFRVNDRWVCNGIDETGNATTEIVRPIENTDITYIKASNTGTSDYFGATSSMSDDGLYLAVGAYQERSNAIGINGDQSDNSSNRAGAAYVFFFDGTSWTQQAYIKASNTETNDFFGTAISISNDGSRLVIGASGDDSNATGINGNDTDNSASYSGAAFVFSRTGVTWTQEAYIKASNTESFDGFGGKVSISKDGTRLAISAPGEDSDANGINGDQTNNLNSSAGAVYLYRRTGVIWSQEAYIKASNSDANDYFGTSLFLSDDGSRLAVGADREGSNATGINGDETNNAANESGAVYVFSRSGMTWAQEAYIKASNTESDDRFGGSLSLSNDGSQLAVGAYGEDSNASGINGNQADNSASGTGALYVFIRTGVVWTQQAYIKASNPNTSDIFGNTVTISGSGTTIFCGATNEDSDARGFNGDQNNNFASASGATYVFSISSGVWSQTGYLKSSNSEASDFFSISISCNINGTRLAVGSRNEESNATGIDGDQTNNSIQDAGAIYIFQN